MKEQFETAPEERKAAEGLLRQGEDEASEPRPEGREELIENTAETKEEREWPEERPLYEVVGEYNRRMERGVEGLESDSIQGLSRAEKESGLEYLDIAQIREETDVLNNLAELRTDAEMLKVGTREQTERDILRGKHEDEFRKSDASKTPFDSKEVLENIRKAPSAERKQLLVKFKEEYAAQRIGLAQMQEEAIQIIREDPDVFMDFDTMRSFVQEEQRRLGLTSGQALEIVFAIGEYNTKHEAVRKIREEHPDDSELYFTLFGKAPRGSVEVIEGPMTLYFRTHDPEDYARIHGQIFLREKDKDTVTEHDILSANMSGGVSIRTSLIPELKGTIIAENIKQSSLESNAIRDHEEQHAINRLFGPKYEFKKIDSYGKIKEAQDYEELEMHVRNYFKSHREAYGQERAKDEVLAYFKEERFSSVEIFRTLIKSREEGGLYDYFTASERLIEFLISTFTLLKESSLNLKKEKVIPIIERVASEVFETEYYKLLGDGIDACNRLERSGYSREQIIAIFQQEPFSKWKKAAGRLLEAKKLEEENLNSMNTVALKKG